MNVGDLVTAADAPEGAPSWLGVFVETLPPESERVYRRGDMNVGYSVPARTLVRCIGDPAPTYLDGNAVVRPLTDSEAVGLAEGLSLCTWERQPEGDSYLGGHEVRGEDPAPFLYADADGSWCASADEWQSGGVAPGKTLDAAIVEASRALLCWMCSP